jgi:RHS repeat-associated protein
MAVSPRFGLPRHKGWWAALGRALRIRPHSADRHRRTRFAATNPAMRTAVALIAILGVLIPSIATAQSVSASASTVASRPRVSSSPAGRSMTVAQAPPSLRSALQKTLGPSSTGPQRRLTDTGGRQLGASYSASGAQFAGTGFKFNVGRGSAGRTGAMRSVGSRLVRSAHADSFEGTGTTESFTPTASGIEQSFHVTTRQPGSGPLVINIPLSGLTATTDAAPQSLGASHATTGPVKPPPNANKSRIARRFDTETTTAVIDLRDVQGRARATYSGLRVTDASGRAVAASMRAVADGRMVTIEVSDSGARYPLTIDPVWSETVRLTESLGAANDQFGQAVALSGSIAIVGSWDTDVNGNDHAGAAYVFNLNGGTWTQTQELTASDGAQGDLFGDSVAISGSTAIVGASGHAVNGVEQGAAYVFNLNGGTWTQTQELTASDGAQGDFFGFSVGLSGSTAIVGAYTHAVNGNPDQGAAYIFALNGGTWTQTQELTASDGATDDGFGVSVAIESGTAFVGAYQHAVNGEVYSGAAYIYSLSGTTWTQTQELTNAYSGESVAFGWSIALAGSTAIIGAMWREVNGVQQGAAYVYTLSGAVWSQTAELTASDGVYGDDFGYSVALSGSTAIIGSPNHVAPGGAEYSGAAYVYTYAAGTWSQAAELSASDDTSGALGLSAALSGSTALVGAPYKTVDDNAAAGAAYVFNAGGSIQPVGSGVSTETYGDGTISAPGVCHCAAGDPVDAATGDFHVSGSDLSLPGAGLPLAFSRTYDAQAAQAEVSAALGAGPLGYGWSDNLGMTVAYNSSTQVATVTEENGAQTTFSPYVSGTSPAWCPSATNFCSTAPRFEATLNHNTNGTWSYVRTVAGAETFTFNSSGVLTSESDTAGDTLGSSVYSAGSGQTACPSGDTCTGWTSSASGRELVLAVNSSNQLVKVFDANSTLASSFSYSGSGCSTWGTGKPVDLCAVTDPGSIGYKYAYDSGNATAALDYDVVSATPPSATAATVNVYNSSGQVTQQTDPAGQVSTFSYSGTNSSLAGGTTTVTTYPDGTGTGEPTDAIVYQYSSNVLVAETVAAGTPSASTEYFQTDPISLAPVSVQDGDGHTSSFTYQTYSGPGGTPVSSGNVLTSTDGAGNTTAYAYNQFNQAWCRIIPAEYAKGVSCPSSPPAAPPAPGASDPNAGAAISFYNSADQLTATTDALGNTTTNVYTSGVSGVPNGLVYCSVDPVDYQKSVSCPAYGAAHVSGTTTATYDSAGDKTASTDADGNTTSYVYASSGHPGLVSSETDPDGTVTSFTYNGAGEVTAKTVTFGSYSATTVYGYDSEGRLYCTIAALAYSQGHTTCQSPAPTSPPTAGSDPWPGQTITIFDSDGRAIDTVNPLGGVTQTGYDQAGEVFCTVTPANYAGGKTCPTPGGAWTAGITITGFDANGRPIQVTNPLGGITLKTYDLANNVTQTTVESNNSTADPNVVTNYGYDSDNRVVSTTVDPGGPAVATSEQAFDPDGNVYCAVSANAVAAGGYQCPPWQTGWITSPPSPTSLYSSTPNSGQANQVTTSFYNADGDQVQTTNPDVDTTVTAVDGDGRTYCSSDPTNVAAWLAAHPSGSYPYGCPSTPPASPPAQGSNPGYVTTIYDAAGRTLSSTDQVGDTTSNTYTPAGQNVTTTDPRGQVTTDCYYYQTGTGQCAHSAPAGAGSGDDLYSATTPATAADPSGETTSDTYYPGDQLDASTTPAGTTTDTYDAAGDLTSSAYTATAAGYSAPTNLSYSYNVDGTRHTTTDATGTTTYSYDAAGDVTTKALVATGSLSNATTSYGYYSTGTPASITYPSYTGHTSPQVTYSYDPTGAMSSETDWLGNIVSFGHDQDGNPTGQDNNVSGTNPNGTSNTAWSYDNADQATQATSSLAQGCGGTVTLTQAFSGTNGSVNPDGQLTQSLASYSGSCSSPASVQRDYSYDPAGRVVYQGSVAQGASANNYGYDPSGDPTTISNHDPSYSFDTYTQTFDNAGEVTAQTPIAGSWGSASSYSHDTLGDLTQTVTGSATNTYGYNQAGQMTTATLPAGASTGYLYNSDGLETGAAAQPAWGGLASIDSTRSISSVSCPTSSFCAAVDTSGYATTFNGTTWTTPSHIDGTHALQSVSCVSSSSCKTVDNAGNVLTYNGSTWSAATSIDSTRSISSVSCPTTSFCAAVDSSGYATTYNGTSWATASHIDGTHALQAVSCVSSSFCKAVDNAGNALTYSGSSWSAASSIDSTRSVTSISCPTTSFCAAVDASGYATTYNGTSWSTPTDIDGTHALQAVSCASSSVCRTVDNTGNALTYSASRWSLAASIDSTRSIKSLACPTTSFCAAVDSSGYGLTLSTSNSAWGSVTAADLTARTSGLSCPTTTFCLAVDGSDYAISRNGASWTPPTQTYEGFNFTALTCASATMCIATDTDGNIDTYNGTSWSGRQSVDSTRRVDAISCPTTTFCALVDASGYATTFNGTTWTTPADIDSTNPIQAVSCVSSSFCQAVDNAGNVTTYNGTSWTTPHSIDSTRAIQTVSCATTSFCLAADLSGYTTTYNGSSWSSPTQVDTNSIQAVACPASNQCYVTDSQGNVLTYNGSAWPTTTDIDNNYSLIDLSCATASFCVTIDMWGNGVVYQPQTSITQLTWDTNTTLPLVLSDSTNDYIYGPTDTPVEQINLTTNNPTYLTYTPTNDTWLSTNQAGDETSYWGYDAFGNLAYGTPASPFGYAGQYTDPTTGLVNDRARDYQPETGGFTARDPAFNLTDTAYTYADDDPVNNSDPTGLFTCGPQGECGSPQYLESLPQPCPSTSASTGLTPQQEDAVAQAQTFINSELSRSGVSILLVGQPWLSQLSPTALQSFLNRLQNYATTAFEAQLSAGRGPQQFVGSLTKDPAIRQTTDGSITVTIGLTYATVAVTIASGPEAGTTFQTYTKVNPDTGDVYVGRTSGGGTPLENIARRDSGHAYTSEGFGPAQLDQSSDSYAAIRGREQQLIDFYRSLGISANKINGISPLNLNRSGYLGAALDEFGPVEPGDFIP